MAVVLGLSACKPAPAGAGQGAPSGQLRKATYETVLRDDNAAIASGEASTKGEITSALVPLELVNLYLERARLTGDYADYGRAEALLARLEPRFARTEGYCLARARVHYALHRLAKAKAVLDACPRAAGTAEDLILRANIAFYSGRYRDAGLIYRALVNQLGTPQAYTQLALFSARTGAPGEAAAFFEAAENRDHGASALQDSWFALQRGLIEMDRGRYAEARALFALADERMPGYWLYREHLAEVALLMGDKARARELYQEVVKQTAAPEYLDALGALEAEAGDTDAARSLFSRAGAAYADRARRFPEAVAGHALEHYLHHVRQPAKALELAQANYANRPHGEAAVMLAKAYLINRRAADAVRLLEGELARGWDTAEAWWVLSLAARAAGDSRRAASAAAEALRRNPHSAAQYAFDF